MERKTRGAIYYVVHNRRYIEFAIRSVASLKRHMPQLPASIYTDLEIPAGHCFDAVEQLPPVPAAWRMNQVMPMLRADYEFHRAPKDPKRILRRYGYRTWTCLGEKKDSDISWWKIEK